MAGSYKDPVGHRIAYDQNGTKGFTIGGSGTQLTQAQLIHLNDEDDTSSMTFGLETNRKLALVFPRPMDLQWMFMSIAGTFDTVTYQVSRNTTDGLDGTWFSAPYFSEQWSASGTSPAYRGDFYSTDPITNLKVSILDVIGIRVTVVAHAGQTGATFQAMHIYGDYTLLSWYQYLDMVYVYSAPAFDHVDVWDPDSDIRAAKSQFDWGYAYKSSSGDRRFRIKNRSPDKSACGMVLDLNALTDTTPSTVTQHLFSVDDGITFTATATLPTLAAGAISKVILVRRVTPRNATLGPWALRLRATVNTWI
jgi:hypothetical protein